MKNIKAKALLLIFIFSTGVFAQQYNTSSNYIFNTISIDEGLPFNFVDDIYKDNHGFIWIATQGGGLSRYDGYEFVNLNIHSVPVSLKSNFIRKVCEDNFNRLWVVSNNGLDVIDLFTMTESNVVKKNDAATELESKPANSLYKDRTGSIWIIYNDVISKIEFENNGSIDKIYHTSLENRQYFTTISEIDNEMWTSSGGTIFKLITEQSGILSLQKVPHIPVLDTDMYISTIHKRDNTIWIGTENGLFRYNTTNSNLKVYTHDRNDINSLTQDMITDLAFTQEGVLVVGTLKGLNFYDPSTDKFERLSHSQNENTISSDFINCLLPDGNILWVGTEAGGINKMTMKKLAVINYTHDINNIYSISPNYVNAIYEDSKENLWIGTVEGGLNLKRKGENCFLHYLSGENMLSHNSVSALEEDGNGNLWIGTWGGGVNILDLNKLPQTSFKHIASLGLSFIGVLKYDSVNNGVWIGTNRNIFYYDLETHNLVEPLHENITKNIMGTLGCIIDESQKLWIGCSRGLMRIDLNSYDKKNNTCPAEYMSLQNLENFGQLFNKNITSIYQAQDKSIWIGSNGYGICKLTPVNDKFAAQLYTVNEGLANNTVFGILEDEQGLIWSATAKGISSYNPVINRFVNYTKNDGLINDQFYWNASFKSPTTNNLYFGTVKGLIELINDFHTDIVQSHKLTFTKLQILNKTVWYNNDNYIKKDIAYADRIDLHEKDKSFSIEFSALDFDNPSTVSYSYRLLGFDDKWIDADANRRFASFTNLKPGNYRLQVRYMSKSYDWSDNITELQVTVHPFFYKTSWFIGLCLFILGLLAILFYKWRINSLKKQREELQDKVKERTEALENKKMRLEEQAEELRLRNNILFNQKEKISLQQKQLMDMSRKVQDAMTDRISFFTNITHEFRTPITLIIGPIERALKLSTNPKVVEQLQFVANNSKNLLSLVNQLMDFRKVESDNMQINPTLGNIVKSINEVLIPFESFAQQRNINIKTIYRMHSSYILFDEEAIRKLITNLLSNAIKFTPDNGFITLYTSIITDKKTHRQKLYICVSDSGTGIKETDLNRIFNRFYQSHDTNKYHVHGQSGTGIGLYLCKNIVNLMGGNIYAKNNPTQGAAFRVIIPLEQVNMTNNMKNDESETIPVNDIQHSEPIPEILKEKQNQTILIVEDNSDMRKYIRSILSDFYKLEEAENGQEALNILKKNQVDFIISDLMMPVMDGFELSRRVKSDISLSHIPFLLLTAKTSVETRINSYKIGVDEFLAKPFDEELLLTRIKNIFDIRKTYQQKFSLNMDMENLSIAQESADEKFLRKAIETVKENYKNTEYEISDFTIAMGVSKSLLNKKMNALTGQSAGNFIRNYRLNIAREMILKSRGSMNISEIAFQVGFNDPKYFTRCFSKHFGIPPSSLNEESNI